MQLLRLLPIFAAAVFSFFARPAVGQIKGVNLGGWLVTEAWITPSLYDDTDADDEWSLCLDLGKKDAEKALQKHWDNFINQTDFTDIAAAGLNTVRIPLGYWAVDLRDWEPYVQGQYPFLISAVQWASQAHLSVIISLHGVPGSQNGQENSGLAGQINFAQNISNVDRALNVLRNLTEQFAQEDAVIAIEVLNEPRISSSFSMTDLRQYYTSGSAAIRGLDPSSSINVTVSDAFLKLQNWQGYNPLTNTNGSKSQIAANVSLDTHQYYAYAPRNNLSQNDMLDNICSVSKQLKQKDSSKSNDGLLPPTLVGEWSLATSNGTLPSSYSTNDTAYYDWLNLFFEAQNAAYSPNGAGQTSIGWIFWTWTTENDAEMWSYRRGLQEGYIPSNISNSSMLTHSVDKHGCVGSGAANVVVRMGPAVFVAFVAAVALFAF